MSAVTWQNATQEALSLTCVYVIAKLQEARERIAPQVLLDMIEEKLTELDTLERERRKLAAPYDPYAAEVRP